MEEAEDELARMEREHTRYELARLRAENARLERALTRKELSRSGVLFLIAFSNMCYGLALVLTIALAAPSSNPAIQPWGWIFVLVFASPLLFMIIIGFYLGTTDHYKQRHTQRTVQQQRLRKVSRQRKLPRTG